LSYLRNHAAQIPNSTVIYLVKYCTHHS
jgi:hypothetical protein